MGRISANIAARRVSDAPHGATPSPIDPASRPDPGKQPQGAFISTSLFLEVFDGIRGDR
ncbi:hypothetical protein [Paracoccus solventivorans]|uniref:hypothetical protein n=1 Tax=Paracoccus solventivorans TaxID=53463 RepID=UPI0026EA484A|nr:hypothetical protein [Paracoccus solventivorans]